MLGAFGHPRLVPELNTLMSGAAVVQSGTSASASVFRQPGSIELDELPGGSRIDLAGHEAWVDPDNDVVVVATDAAVVTRVGVGPEEAEALLGEIDEGPDGFTRV